MDVKCIAKTSCLSTRCCYFKFKDNKSYFQKDLKKQVIYNISQYIYHFYINILCILNDIKFETFQFFQKQIPERLGCRAQSQGSHHHNQWCSGSPRWNIKHRPRNGIHAPWLWPPRSIAIKALPPKKNLCKNVFGLIFWVTNVSSYMSETHWSYYIETKILTISTKHLNSKLRKITLSSKQIITQSPSTNCLKNFRHSNFPLAPSYPTNARTHANVRRRQRFRCPVKSKTPTRACCSCSAWLPKKRLKL